MTKLYVYVTGPILVTGLDVLSYVYVAKISTCGILMVCVSLLKSETLLAIFSVQYSSMNLASDFKLTNNQQSN